MRINQLALGALLTIALVGCQAKQPEAKLAGVLTLADQPLDHCLITFLPETTTSVAAAAAVTDAQGSYVLRTNDEHRRGIPPGHYRVTIQDLSVTTGVVRRERGTIDADLPATPPAPPRASRIPTHYADVGRTTLQVTATAGDQTFNIKLPSP